MSITVQENVNVGLMVAYSGFYDASSQFIHVSKGGVHHHISRHDSVLGREMVASRHYPRRAWSARGKITNRRRKSQAGVATDGYGRHAEGVSWTIHQTP